jgi:hypothetical protein
MSKQTDQSEQDGQTAHYDAWQEKALGATRQYIQADRYKYTG